MRKKRSPMGQQEGRVALCPPRCPRAVCPQRLGHGASCSGCQRDQCSSYLWLTGTSTRGCCSCCWPCSHSQGSERRPKIWVGKVPGMALALQLCSPESPAALTVTVGEGWISPPASLVFCPLQSTFFWREDPHAVTPERTWAWSGCCSEPRGAEHLCLPLPHHSPAFLQLCS